MPVTDAETALVRRTARLIWGIVAAMAAVLCAGYAAAGLSLDLWSGRYLLPLAPACAAIAWFYRSRRPDPWIAFGAEATAQLLAILLTGCLISYAAAAAAFPYRDAELHALDRALGFDWRAYLDFLNAHPALGLVSNLAYASMKPQTPLVIAVLVVTARFTRLQQFTLATAVALSLTLIVFMLVPAVAYFAHLGVTPADFANLTPAVPYEHIRHLEGIRTGATRVIRLDDLEGLITFPSFHAASAVLFVWALWPLRRLRWGIVALNALMLASTPIDGAHYVIDLAGGMAIAGFAVLAAKWATARLNAPAAAMPRETEATAEPRSATAPV